MKAKNGKQKVGKNMLEKYKFIIIIMLSIFGLLSNLLWFFGLKKINKAWEEEYQKIKEILMGKE